MAVKYVGERSGRYDRYERSTRKNVSRWMNPQPVSRRADRWYVEYHESGYWLWTACFTIVAVFLLLLVWWICG